VSRLEGRVDLSAFDPRLRETESDVDALMAALLPHAAMFSDPPVSGFRVGAIARGELGTLYVGVNVEFAGMPLSCSVHAEQAAVSNARRHRERRIVALATSAVPCGHCRQFLHELPRAAEIRILQPGAAAASPGEPLPRATAVTLGELLPHAFSPHDLGAAGDLLDERRTELVRDDGSDDELLDAARAAAERAYVPYGRTHSGVALRTADGAIHRGSALESVAYNPSLPPLQDALVSLRQTGRRWGDVVEAALVEADGPVSHRAHADALARALGLPPLRFGRVRLR